MHALKGPDVAADRALTAILLGEPPFRRDHAPEPSLLPHLARLCRSEAVDEVWWAADVCRRGMFGWPALFECTANQLVRRFDDDVLRSALGGSSCATEIAVRRCVAASAAPPAALWRDVDMLDEVVLRHDLSARLLTAAPDVDRFELLMSELEPADAGSETARAMIAAAAALGRPLHQDDVDVLTGTGIVGVAHVLPWITDPRYRTQLADSVVAELARADPPDWWLVLALSRIGPYLSDPIATGVSSTFHPEREWSRLFTSLRTSWSDRGPEEDVLRAHPCRSRLDRFRNARRAVTGIGREIVERHGGSGPPPTSAAAPPDEIAAPQPPPPAPAPPGLHPAAEEARASHAAPPRPRTCDQSDERRLGVDLFLDGRAAPLPLPTGRDVALQVSIGFDAAVDVPLPVPVEFPPGVVMRFLPVRFVSGGTDLTETMSLPADPRSSGSVMFRLVAEAPALRGTIIVYNEDRSAVLVAAAMSAPVSTGDDDTDRRTVQLVLVDAAALGRGPCSGSSSVVDDGCAVTASSPGVVIPASTLAVRDQFDDIVAALHRASSHHALAEATILPTITAVARIGAQLRVELGLDALSSSDRIQMVALDPQSVFPLDLIYGADEPDTDAVLCTTWIADAATGRCSHCRALDPAGQRRVVCPLWFWGLSKVIEHHRPDTSTTQYVARVHVSDDETHVKAATTVVVGASQKVSAGAADALADVGASAARLATVDVVANWDEWRHAVAAGPAVLIAMPHHDELIEAGIGRPALELGGELVPSIGEDLVRAPGDRPGPIVLLLGCDTAVEHTHLLSFASSFRRYAPVVVATLGEVLVPDSPAIAQAIIGELTRPTAEPRTVGEAMRAARCALMADARPAALQLVLHGDGDWVLSHD